MSAAHKSSITSLVRSARAAIYDPDMSGPELRLASLFEARRWTYIWLEHDDNFLPGPHLAERRALWAAICMHTIARLEIQIAKLTGGDGGGARRRAYAARQERDRLTIYLESKQ